MKILLTLSLLFSINSFSQTKTSIEKPFIEASGKADTLVIPNKIWVNVLLMEKDFKGKKSVEDMEKEMILKLESIGINTEKKLSLNYMSSNFKNYALKQTDIFKSKSYSVLVTDANTTAKVFISLEEIGISNVRIEKVENTEEEKIKLLINGKAILNAKQTAESFAKPLNQKVGNAIQISTFEIMPNQVTGQLNEVVVRGYSSKPYGNRNPNYESNIEFEKIKISSSVQAKFLLE
ncbi:SIMPL domain-containing protein [Flavobacterium sp. RS13.1]|uniref:SIMPL domain-containing protein n=1 Tax=Flavobacterium sp. RS13.1 TaxID=3400345 RepID=UPI003AB10166